VRLVVWLTLSLQLMYDFPIVMELINFFSYKILLNFISCG